MAIARRRCQDFFTRESSGKEEEMMRKMLTWMVAGAALPLAGVRAQAACSNSTLHGRYAFTITGQILAPAPAAGLVSGTAMTVFDGDGDLTQVDHVVHNGVAPIEDWRPATGSYGINPDCTGWMTITAHPTQAADASPELKLFIVVTRDGSQVDTVVSGSPTAAAFAANITSIGVRRGEDDDD